MIWIRRRYSSDQPWTTTPIMRQVQKHFMAMGGPTSMLMIEENHGPLDSTIWIRLPDKKPAALYPDFEVAPEDQLPGKAVLLIGNGDEFEKLFKFGSSKDG